MLCLLLIAQLGVTVDSAYSASALRQLVDRAAIENHAPPREFGGYRARVETELSLIIRDTLGRENAAQVEQLASAVHWTRGGRYDMRVVGYRSQGIGVPYSTLSFVRGWTEPSLYGERLMLGAQMGSTRSQSSTAQADTIIAVHPFASDRDRYYRFSGGDTVATLKTGTHVITIVRVHVTPHLPDSTRFAAFDGDIQLDAERAQIVRMRGQFVVRGPPRARTPLLARMPGLVGVAYSDFVNAEVNGRYWLPAAQRTEFQSAIVLLGASRAVMRILSHFSDYEIDAASGLADDSRRPAHVTTWAPSDSVNRYGDWQESIGTATASVNAGDFDDIAPDIWRATGRPRFDLFPTRSENLIGYDRVGGLYTGLEGQLRMRDAFPGLSASARGGWSWSEHTVRGGVNVSLRRGLSIYGARAERSLASTNDFVRPLDPTSGGIGAFVSSIDDHDYVDRRSAVAAYTRALGSFDNSFLTLQAGAGNDRSEVARLTHGVLSSSRFRPNRGAYSGSYARGSIDVELHPGVSGDFVRPGVGGRFRYEVGAGTLDWQRAELSLSARRYAGPITLTLQADAGAVFGSAIPPQQLFELGGIGTLSGYAYKEFSGDRAALFRSYASYTFPVLRKPLRVFRNLYLPGLAPGFAIGGSGGWTNISSASAQASVSALGVGTAATGNVRATAGVGLTLFGGNVHLGVARPVDHAAPWKSVFGVGTQF